MLALSSAKCSMAQVSRARDCCISAGESISRHHQSKKFPQCVPATLLPCRIAVTNRAITSDGWIFSVLGSLKNKTESPPPSSAARAS